MLASECSEFGDKVEINARLVPPTQEDAEKNAVWVGGGRHVELLSGIKFFKAREARRIQRLVRKL